MTIADPTWAIDTGSGKLIREAQEEVKFLEDQKRELAPGVMSIAVERLIRRAKEHVEQCKENYTTITGKRWVE